MNKFIKLILLLNLFLANICFGQQLAANSQELKQLEAMGYDLTKFAASGLFTYASVGSTTIVISKTEDRTVVSRWFTMNKKLNQQQELELLRAINKINVNLSYQASLDEKVLSVNLYIYGAHDPKTFAKVIRMIESANVIFDKYPEIAALSE